MICRKLKKFGPHRVQQMIIRGGGAKMRPPLGPVRVNDKAFVSYSGYTSVLHI